MRAKTRYLVISSIVVGSFVAIATVVSIKVASAEQLALPTKLAVWALFWGFILYSIRIFIRYYRKLEEE